jgi:hypothetical protein
VAALALSTIRRPRLSAALAVVLMAVVALLLSAASPVAEGSQGGAEAQPSSTAEPVAALLGTVAATVDRAAGREVLPAPPPPDASAADLPPAEDVVTAVTGQEPAPDSAVPLRAAAGSAGTAPRRSAPDAGTALQKAAEPLRRVTGATLHRATGTVDGVLAKVPAVAQPVRRAAGEVVSVADELLAETPLAPGVSRASGPVSQPGGGVVAPGFTESGSLTPAAAGEPGLLAGEATLAAVLSPAACAACAGGPSVPRVPGAAVGAISAMGVSSATGTVLSPGPPAWPSVAAGAVPASFSASQLPSTPRSPAPSGVSSAGGVAAVGVGLALALAWLLATVLPGVTRRWGERPHARLVAPFELILQRPG